MKFLAILVLLSALVIAGTAAYFSIVGLSLLFIGSGLSIVIMGSALELGKIVAVSFLHQKWQDISLALKAYLMVAVLVLMAITSIGIYGYLSAGYNATTIKLQGLEQQITFNESKIDTLKSDNVQLLADPLNQKAIETTDSNRDLYVNNQLRVISTKEQKIQSIRDSVKESDKSSQDLTSARMNLDAAKKTLDLDTSKEVEQINLYNARLGILDKEVQTWLDQGTGGLFKKNGITQARAVKEAQAGERAAIDAQIAQRQERIEALRKAYQVQVDEYNQRVNNLDARYRSQVKANDEAIQVLENEIAAIHKDIATQNETTESNIKAQQTAQGILQAANKETVAKNEKEIQVLTEAINETKEKIVHTDVGTFKFVAQSMGLGLDKTVTYFIWSIMFVFDPLAVCLILCFNYLVSAFISKKKEPVIEPTSTPTPVSTTIPMKSSEIVFGRKEEKRAPVSVPSPNNPVARILSEAERLEKILAEQRAEKLTRHAND